MLKALRRLVAVLALLTVALAVFVAFFVLEDEPLVARVDPPTPDDIVAARAFLHQVRDAARKPGSTPVRVTGVDLNRMMRLGGRLVPGYRGRIAVAEDVRGEASVPVPWPGGTRWLNLSASAPPFAGRFALSRVSVGPFDLPPGPVLWLGRVGGDAIVGNGFGSTVLGAASAMRIEGDSLAFDLDIGAVGQNGVMRGVFGTLRGASMPQPDEIDRHYVRLREAMDRGDLPVEGSYLPYLRFMLAEAYEDGRDGDLANAYTAAIFALARACGARDFSTVVGGYVGGDAVDDRDWAQRCNHLTLNGRVDSRRHFTTAAALQAASNRGVAVSIGEFKEMYDSLKSGGFDFTDIAANNSGIRMSNRLMEARPEAWPDLLARITAESDLIVPYDGIPDIMSAADFAERYGEVDSPAYKAQLAEIEARIDRLALHAAP